VLVPELGLGEVFPRPFDVHGASFADLLRRTVPDAVPDWLRGGPVPAALHDQIVEGTTVLALSFVGGVVVAGDRRATAGNLISQTDMRKVFPADHHSAVAISGAAGPAMELARILATELEHYEKVEGEALSLEGKSNKLAGMVRANLPLAMQGLVVVPLFAGVEPRTGTPGIFEYDPVGGRYLARRYAASGSGSLVARQTLKRRPVRHGRGARRLPRRRGPLRRRRAGLRHRRSRPDPAHLPDRGDHRRRWVPRTRRRRGPRTGGCRGRRAQLQ
jgi:proteasome beta subunit